MIFVQIEVTDPAAEPAATTPAWFGWWEQAPQVGHTIQLRRNRDTDPDGRYRVTGVDWVVPENAQASHAYQAPVTTCTVTVEEYRP
jgi:hypothetical protein